MSPILPPQEWKDHPPCTLDILLFVRQQIREGTMPEMFFGRIHIHAMAAFVDGVHFTMFCHHRRDREYMEFIDWLRDAKNEFPAGGGWSKKFLKDCKGDHLAAINKFLDFVAEFVALKRRAP